MFGLSYYKKSGVIKNIMSMELKYFEKFSKLESSQDSELSTIYVTKEMLPPDVSVMEFLVKTYDYKISDSGEIVFVG